MGWEGGGFCFYSRRCNPLTGPCAVSLSFLTVGTINGLVSMVAPSCRCPPPSHSLLKCIRTEEKRKRLFLFCFLFFCLFCFPFCYFSSSPFHFHRWATNPQPNMSLHIHQALIEPSANNNQTLDSQDICKYPGDLLRTRG